MRYISTRGSAPSVGLSEAISRGIAPDGGLYVPERLPRLDPDDFPDIASLADIAARLLRPFVAGDSLEPHLHRICEATFTFPAPLVRLEGTPGPASVLELFHGPTSAFKDFGAQFLAACLEAIARQDRKLTILVATSGDTGGAVAAAFHRVPWADVVLLYPKGLVSPRQAQQLACWGDNVRTLAVRGNFDDCQRLVKEAFQDPELTRAYTLSSANSINIGRLLPQMVYYAQASLRVWRDESRRPNFIIPSGNLGNAVACVLAREVGLPIGDIVLATNENRTIADFFEEGRWLPRPGIPTLASAMDVGNPSNMERLRYMFGGEERARGQLTAGSVSDGEIRERIRGDHATLLQIWCPHTATAASLYWRVAESRAAEHWILVATAHPAKFSDIVEPLIGAVVPIPAALQRLLDLPPQQREIAADLDSLRLELMRRNLLDPSLV